MTSDSDLVVAERFSQRDIVPSAHCTRFLSESVDYVKAAASTTAVQPVDFCRGDGAGWAPIEQSLDVKRALSENVLLDVFLNTPADDPNDPEVVLIKGHAGAGKSVLLRRIAWQASHDFNALCLFIRADAHIDKEAVVELLELVDERVYLFVDDAARHVRELVSLIRQTNSERRRITYVLGERLNEWNVYGGPLASFITNEFVVEYRAAHQATAERVFDFFGVGHGTVRTEHRKVNTFSFEELIVNYTEFMECMRQHGWTSYIDEEPAPHGDAAS